MRAHAEGPFAGFRVDHVLVVSRLLQILSCCEVGTYRQGLVKVNVNASDMPILAIRIMAV